MVFFSLRSRCDLFAISLRSFYEVSSADSLGSLSVRARMFLFCSGLTVFALFLRRSHVSLKNLSLLPSVYSYYLFTISIFHLSVILFLGFSSSSCPSVISRGHFQYLRHIFLSYNNRPFHTYCLHSRSSNRIHCMNSGGKQLLAPLPRHVVQRRYSGFAEAGALPRVYTSKWNMTGAQLLCLTVDTAPANLGVYSPSAPSPSGRSA